VATRLRLWAAQEIAADRLLPWLAAAYGFGIVIYFTAEREPSFWAAAILAGGCAIAAVQLRRHLTAFLVLLFAFALSAGFTVATWKTASIAHPILRYPASGVTVAGFVELREESQHTDRMVIRVDRLEGSRIADKPQRVRLSVKRGMAPPPGSYVEVKALLEPPLQPLLPGAYDFARDLYFQQIGASGFVRGAVKIIAPPLTEGLRQRANAVVQRMRDAIDVHVRSVLTGDTGAIAAMLLNGRRDVISENLFNALFISGVGHVLSISGYHMAVVAGVVFFLFRALLALIPGLADRAPIKKWAAFGALLATTFYLVLSGAEVATQRSYVMIAIVLIGVMLDRPGIMAQTPQG
jgi:competence protein ComEC